MVLSTYGAPKELPAAGSSVSILECTAFLSITSHLCEAQFWAFACDKQNKQTKVPDKDHGCLGNEAGCVLPDSNVWEALGVQRAHMSHYNSS